MKSIVFLAFVLAGCAAHQWAPGPGQSIADFEPAKARCSMLARHGGSDFVAYGPQNYVAGAALGHAIGESIRANQDFNDCMVASGWRIADGQTTAAQSAAVQSKLALLKEITDQRKACVAEIRNKPAYAPLELHLSELDTGNYFMTQLTDEHIATASESHLMALFQDDGRSCGAEFIDAATKVAPAIGPILLQQRASVEATLILLRQRKITWGEEAQRVTQATDEAKVKWREVRL